MAQQKNILHIKSPHYMNSLFIGNFKAAFSGKGIEFQDFREYNSGDDAKYIDWVRSSREGTTIMRRYKEEKQGNILCVLDISETLEYENTKIKETLIREITQLLGYSSIMSGEGFGGYIISETDTSYIPPKKSVVSLHELLGKEETQKKGKHKTLSLNFLFKNPLKKSIIFVLTDSLDVDMRSFKIASMKHDVLFIHISTHFENTLEGGGISFLRKGKMHLGIDLDDSEKKKLYREKRSEKLKIMQKDLQKIHIDSLFLDETSSLYAEFLKLMKFREQK